MGLTTTAAAHDTKPEYQQSDEGEGDADCDTSYSATAEGVRFTGNARGGGAGSACDLACLGWLRT
jgi:hypothetical protein